MDLALDTRDALAKSIYAAVFKCGLQPDSPVVCV